MRFLFKFAVFLLLLWDNTMAQESSGIAIVVNVNGEVQRISSKNKKLKTGNVLSNNDSISLSKNATITLLEQDGRLVAYDRSFRLNSQLVANTIVQKLIRQNAQIQNWIESARKTPKNNFRSQTDSEITMSYPRNTRLRKSPDQLSWKGPVKTDTEFGVSLRCYDNDFSYDEVTKSNSLRLGSDVSISPKRQYYWYVRDVHSELSEVPPAVWFYVLSPQELHNLELEKTTIMSIMKQDTLSVAYQLLYVNLLMSYELNDECLIVLDSICKTDPHNSVTQTFYAILFDKMEMINESQKYIDYSDKFGN